MNDLAYEIATVILAGYTTYNTQFKSITRRARRCFELEDWHKTQKNAVARLDVYTEIVGRTVIDVERLIEEYVQDKLLWMEIKKCYSELVRGTRDEEISETFFNSISRRIFSRSGVDSTVEFVLSDTLPYREPTTVTPQICRGYRPALYLSTFDLIWDVLNHSRFSKPIDNATEAAQMIADQIEINYPDYYQIDVIDAVFFRNKAAYVVGRILVSDGVVPLVIALRSNNGEIEVDAFLHSEDELSIIFSFAHTYFHVDTNVPGAIIAFLKSLLPRKPLADLWISIGYNRHAKTILYRDLVNHLEGSDDQFEIAAGTPGMVMTVFTLPSYELVFKIIKDRFEYPKTSTPEEVMDRYRLVFRHDRAGRLLDAQSFEQLYFKKDRFKPELLEHLLENAANTVGVEGEWVVISFLYIERRVKPLNLYLRDASEDEAKAAALEYGQAIKDLAATNIFPGDLFLKNFGVTRHGRVLFYDYDELCFVDECNFRHIPEPPDYLDEMSDQVWYPVQPGDVFPEQFIHFLGLKPHLKKYFLQNHREILKPEFWEDLKSKHHNGWLPSVYPYPESARVPRNHAVEVMG